MPTYPKPLSFAMTLFSLLLSVLLFPLLAFGALGSAAEGEGGEGDSGGGDKGGAKGTDPAQSFQNALAKAQGDAMALATKLFDENFGLREKNRELTARVPPEGAVVLHAADATAWQAYQGLGKPEEVQAAIGERDSLKQAASDREHQERVASAASLLKWNAAVLERELKHDGLSLEIEGEGDKRKVHVVKQDGTKSALDAYAKEQWAALMPALQAKDARQPVLGTPSRDTRGHTPPPAPETPQRPLVIF